MLVSTIKQSYIFIKVKMSDVNWEEINEKLPYERNEVSEAAKKVPPLVVRPLREWGGGGG